MISPQRIYTVSPLWGIAPKEEGTAKVRWRRSRSGYNTRIPIEKITDEQRYHHHHSRGMAAITTTEFPALNNDQERGLVYHVQKVGFYLASQEECEQLPLNPQQIFGEKYALPTAYVKFANLFELCKLPLELMDWMVDIAALTHQGANSLT